MKKKTIFLKFILITSLYFFVVKNNYSQGLTNDTLWHSLFNGKNLQGWNTFLGVHDKDKPYLINIDTNKVFQVIEGNLHLYKDHLEDSIVQEGYIYTIEEYSNYRLRMEFMWGGKKFLQRKNKKKNSGLFFHIQEPTGFWPTCSEFQIMEGSVGDVYAQNFAWFTTTIDSFIYDPQSKKKFPHYSETGKVFDYGGKQTSMRLINLTPLDYSEGWNTIEIVVQENSAIFYVNDKLAAKLWNIRYVPPDNPEQEQPLIKGRIGLQAEATEIIFRNIEIKLNPK